MLTAPVPAGTLLRLPRDLPMPISGTTIDDVLYLFEADPYRRQDLILEDKGAHDFLVESLSENPLLPVGWLLLSDDQRALFRAMTHWETNGWTPIKPRGELFWELAGVPEGLFPDFRLLEGFFADGSNPSQIKRVFLEHYFQSWVNDDPDPDCYLVSVASASRWILDARSRVRQAARRLASDLNIEVPRLSPRELDAWVMEHSPVCQARRVGALLGLEPPADAGSLGGWLSEWSHLAEPLELAGVEAPDIERLKAAWLSERRT